MGDRAKLSPSALGTEGFFVATKMEDKPTNRPPVPVADKKVKENPRLARTVLYA